MTTSPSIPLSIRSVGAVLFNNRIHVFIMPALLTLFWDAALKIGLPLTYYAMIVLNTAGAYMGNMKTDYREDAVNYPSEGRFLHPQSFWLRPAIVAAFAGSFLLGLLSGWLFVLYGFVLNIFGILYGLEVPLPGGRRFRVKSIPWLKNAYSSLFWSVALLVSPYLYVKQALDPRLALAIPIAFLLAFFVELLWDVRDTAGDEWPGFGRSPPAWATG